MPESVETPAPVRAARRWPASTSTTSAREPAVIGTASFVVLTHPPYDADSEDGLPTRYPSRRGSVSERPKEHASKACVGESPPWVQIPPLPPMSQDIENAPTYVIVGRGVRRRGSEQGAAASAAGDGRDEDDREVDLERQLDPVDTLGVAHAEE